MSLETSSSGLVKKTFLNDSQGPTETQGARREANKQVMGQLACIPQLGVRS